MQLKKCLTCNSYTLSEVCGECNHETHDPHYTFKKIRDAPKDSAEYFDKKRTKKARRAARAN